MNIQEFENQFRKFFPVFLKELNPRVKINNRENAVIKYGIESDSEYGVDIQKKYEAFQQLCALPSLDLDRYKNVESFAQLVVEKILKQHNKEAFNSLKIQREDIILTLLPKSRIDAIGEIPYRMFGEKMAICIAYDNENIRAYLNEEKCKELNVSLDENFEELRQNLERRISQSSISWQEMLEGITIIKGDNAASWLLTDSFWEPGFFPASTSVFPTKKIEIITIIDQDFICVESYDSFTNHVQQTQQTHPAMDYSLVIKMLSSVFVSFKEPHYEGEMFIRTNGKTEPFKPLINKKAENSKQNHKWWKFW